MSPWVDGVAVEGAIEIMAIHDVPAPPDVHSIECEPAGVLAPFESPAEAAPAELLRVVPVPAIIGPVALFRAIEFNQQLSAFVVMETVSFPAPVCVTVLSTDEAWFTPVYEVA
jgi:hypothetical protein